MKLWLYKHFKWWTYEVIWVWYNSENRQEEVIYKMLYNTPDFPIWTLWIRPKKMFEETIERDWKLIQRFSYIWNKKNKNV